MSTLAFSGYWDGWEAGDPVVVFVPVDVDYTTPYNWINYSPAQLTEVSYYSNIYTVFIQTNLAAYLESGFYVPSVSIIDCQLNAGRKIYFGANTYIEIIFSNIQYGPALRLYKNGNYLGQITAYGGDRGLTLTSADGDGRYFYMEPRSAITMYLYRYGSLAGAGNFWEGIEPYQPVTDPYAQGGESDTGGGTGTFDGTSVDVDFSSLPSLSAVDTGFITLYNPTLTQLQSLASYMWSGLFDLDTFKKLFADPMQAILGLSIVPGPVPSGATQNVRIGNIDSGVSMTKAATQYIDIDCGTLNVEEFWGAYLDYEPYTKAEIFLPFIGVHQIAIDDIMNKSVHIKYHIDLLSGGCACEIKCGGSVLYTFIGSCAVSIPVTGSDWTNLINGVLSAASAIGTMVATGGAAAPAAASTIASAAVNSLKPSIEKSGSIAGAGGLLAGKVPVLILTRPRQALPGKQNTFTGYPAFITRSLGALSGYTEVHSIRLSGIDGTESEIDEIEELLKGGVIL